MLKKSFIILFSIFLFIVPVLVDNSGIVLSYKTFAAQKTVQSTAVIPVSKSITKEASNKTDNIEYNQKLSDLYNNKNVSGSNESLPKPPSFLDMVFSLGIVIALIFLFAWVYGKIKGVNTTSVFSKRKNLDDTFSILATAPLGQGRNLHLVEINNTKIVIGSTANNISLLTELPTGKTPIDSNFDDNFIKIPFYDMDTLVNKDKSTNNLPVFYDDLYKEYIGK